MKRDNNKNNKTEIFFRNLASSYAEKSGSELQKELANLDGSRIPANLLPLDKQVKSRIRAAKVKKWTARLMPAAACFIIFMMYLVISTKLPAFDSNSDGSVKPPDSAVSDSNKPSSTLTFEFVSAKLPQEYMLRKIDYDYHKAIYYIINSDGVEIILTIEEYTGNIDPDGFDTMRINDTNAYSITTADYSFIQYKKDGFLYMLTSPNDDYGDLIKISESLI